MLCKQNSFDINKTLPIGKGTFEGNKNLEDNKQSVNVLLINRKDDGRGLSLELLLFSEDTVIFLHMQTTLCTWSTIMSGTINKPETYDSDGTITQQQLGLCDIPKMTVDPMALSLFTISRKDLTKLLVTKFRAIFRRWA